MPSKVTPRKAGVRRIGFHLNEKDTYDNELRDSFRKVRPRRLSQFIKDILHAALSSGGGSVLLHIDIARAQAFRMNLSSDIRSHLTQSQHEVPAVKMPNDDTQPKNHSKQPHATATPLPEDERIFVDNTAVVAVPPAGIIEDSSFDNDSGLKSLIH